MRSGEFLSAMSAIDEKLVEASSSCKYGRPGAAQGRPVRRAVVTAVAVVLGLSAAVAASLIVTSRYGSGSESGGLPAGTGGTGEGPDGTVSAPSRTEETLPGTEGPAGDEAVDIAVLWDEYLREDGGDVSVGSVYGFAARLWRSGRPVIVRRNMFTVSVAGQGLFTGWLSDMTVVPSGEDNAEKEIYLYFIAVLTGSLGDCVYYSDVDYRPEFDRMRSDSFYLMLGYGAHGAQSAESFIKAAIADGQELPDDVLSVSFTGRSVRKANGGANMYPELRAAAGVLPAISTPDKDTAAFLEIIEANNRRYFGADGMERVFVAAEHTNPESAFSVVEIPVYNASRDLRLFEARERTELFIVCRGAVRSIGVFHPLGTAVWDYDGNGIEDLLICYDPFSGVFGLKYIVLDLTDFSRRHLLTAVISEGKGAPEIELSDGDLYVNGTKVTWSGTEFNISD
jgi:hypothetical protein